MTIYDESNVYFAYIAFNRDQDDAGGVFVSNPPWRHDLTPARPVDWNTLTVFHDKEYITVDTTGGPYDGYVYVTWTRFAGSYPIYFSRSTDGGAASPPRPDRRHSTRARSRALPRMARCTWPGMISAPTAST
jgi:hypothetical protein